MPEASGTGLGTQHGHDLRAGDDAQLGVSQSRSPASVVLISRRLTWSM